MLTGSQKVIIEQEVRFSKHFAAVFFEDLFLQIF